MLDESTKPKFVKKRHNKIKMFKQIIFVCYLVKVKRWILEFVINRLSRLQYWICNFFLLFPPLFLIMNIFSPLSTLRFSIHYYTMILQRIRVIVRDAGDSNPIAIFVQPYCQWFNLCGVSRMLVCFLHILSVRRFSTYRFLLKTRINRLNTWFFRFTKMFACKARNLRVYLTTLTENFSLF